MDPPWLHTIPHSLRGKPTTAPLFDIRPCQIDNGSIRTEGEVMITYGIVSLVLSLVSLIVATL